MDTNNQIETVKKALELEEFIADTQETLNALSTKCFKNAPPPPVCIQVDRSYPIVKSNLPIDKVKAIVPTLFFWPWILIYYFKIYKKEKLADEERIRNSDEYKAQCAALDLKYDKQQSNNNAKYEEAKKIYDTETMPKYQQELREWTDKHNAEIKDNKKKLDNAESELSDIYNNTNLIPMQYREIPALQYIYDMISSSDYGVKEAIENYDKKVQRDLDMHKISEQQIANQLAYEQNQLSYEQNALLEEQNNIADKARKQANAAAFVGAVQRHNTNKALKNRTKR